VRPPWLTLGLWISLVTNVMAGASPPSTPLTAPSDPAPRPSQAEPLPPRHAGPVSARQTGPVPPRHAEPVLSRHGPACPGHPLPHPAGTVGTNQPTHDEPACPPPITLTRGINITAWFRFPASRDPDALAAYLSDQALADIRAAGFDFVRLAIDPTLAETQRPTLITAIKRIQRQGLTVIVSPHPANWHLETDPADRERLRTFWQTLAPALRTLDQARTIPEILNEPVFPNDPATWATLQHQVLTDIRQALPNATIILTGQDWGSMGGLLALTPENDPNVLYSFHFYDPAELTSLAAYHPNLDRKALARLPFPAGDRPSCEATAANTADPPTSGLMRYYCALGWNAPRIAETIDRAATWADQHHVHLIAGEFGASADLNAKARDTWLKTVRDAFEARGIAWALWGYDDVMGLAVSRPPTKRPTLNPSVLIDLGMTTGM
jgi:endoglucanase